MRVFTIDNDKVDSYFLKSNIIINNTKFTVINDKVFYEKQDTTISSVELNQWIDINDEKFLILNDQYYQYEYNGKLLLSPFGDIVTDSTILIENNMMNAGSCFLLCHNNKLVDNKEILLQEGDEIIVDNLVFTYHYDSIISWGKPFDRTKLKLNKEVEYHNPVYEKSPRVFYRFDEKVVDLLNPPGKEKISKNKLVRIIIPPLISILATGLMAYFTRRGIFVIIAAITTICSLTFSITSFFQEKKQIKKENKNRKLKYNEYLLDQRKELFDLYNNEVEIYNYMFPSAEDISLLINSFSSRIYEKDSKDSDFLRVSMGYTDVDPHYQIKFNNSVLELEEDVLVNKTKELYSHYNRIKNVKYSVDLKENHIGVIGERRLVFDEIKRLILEISCFHSYHDVNLVLLYDQQYKQDFQFVDWLRHAKIEGVNVTANIFNNKVKEQVLSSLYQILRQRAMQVKEEKEENKFSPHFVMYIDDVSLIVNHPIMEFLQGDLNLGISLILRVDKFSDLPSNFKTVFVLKDRFNIDLVLLNGQKQNLRLLRDKIDTVDIDTTCRNLAILDHQLGMSNSIPDMVTFLEMYQVDKVEELDVINRWNNSNIYESIEVPLGLRGDNDIVYLNLHEKFHGPHGLVAGTTGSGKSEIIQTYILSLAVNFSPYDVGFLLIDFKGGGMANLFKGLPHLMGTITNLDGADSMRALASIKSELKRRQTIFNENNVNNINLYTKLFKQNPSLEPLPHLFIISDEFAELKKEQPEFMDELVSVARIGRTLGVHLILATQKPTGVVNDQIWSNSKFKLALKVQDESDSKEILKTPDAAYITKTGRAYLQVGNNEIYELFQSAWSGATYDSESGDEVQEIDKRVYLVNELGQKQLLNQSLSDVVDEQKNYTQLDAVIEHISTEYNNCDFAQVKKAWLPPLEPMIINPNVLNYNFIDLSTIDSVDLSASIGFVDIPDQQDQKVISIDFASDSNLVVYGSSGSGKSLFLLNVIVDLAIKNNPENLSFYIIDLGNAGLVGLKKLVHVADYINFNTLDKIKKLINRVDRILNQRKEMLDLYSVQNVSILEKVSKDKIQRIFIVIDNYDAVKELDDSVSKFFELISRDGPSLGVYLVTSASKSSSIKTAITNNLKNKISLYQNDSSEYSICVGKTKYAINENHKGRALVKLTDVYQMQTYTPFDLEDLIEFNNNLSCFIEKINNDYTGLKPKPIPEIPDKFISSDLDNYDFEDENVTENIVGVTTSDVLKVGLESIPPLFVVLGPNKSGKTNVLKLLINQLDYPPFIIDSNRNGLVTYKNKEGCHYVNSIDEFNEFFETLTEEIEIRISDAEEAFESGEFSSYQQYYESLPDKVVFIDDIDDFITNYNSICDVGRLVKDGINVNIKFVIAVNSVSKKVTVTSDKEDLIKLAKASVDYLVLGNQSTFSIVTIPSSKIPKLGYGVLGTNGELISIRIPLERSS